MSEQTSAQIIATAPGKVILAGEHAVVYGRPAIAVPVWERVARATLIPRTAGAGCLIHAPDTQQQWTLGDTFDADAPVVVARATLARYGLPPDPDWQIELTSTIPVASGLGSGAALLAALVRVILTHAGIAPEPAAVSELVYLGEQVYHGTPSGIDNSVVSYGLPIWFVKGEAPEVFAPAQAIYLAIADSGVPSPTRETVAGVRARRIADPARYDALFDEIAVVVKAVRAAIETGRGREEMAALGTLFDRNHALLGELGVSTPQLDRLAQAARGAGALGAKLSGGGGGGNLIALVQEETAAAVQAALEAAGAVRVVLTSVPA